MIEILNPGMQCTIQDMGRFGHGEIGVTPSGAVDSMALEIANKLVGNSLGAAALEFTLSGSLLKFDREIYFSLAGSDFAATLDGKAVHEWQTHSAKSGSLLEMRGPQDGGRVYLAVAGGIHVPLVLGSRSTHLLAKFGGGSGRPLVARDKIAIGTNDWENEQFDSTIEGLRKCEPRLLEKLRAQRRVIKVTAGPEVNMFEEQEVKRFFEVEHRALAVSNRNGVRFEKAAPLNHTKEILTRGMDVGSIQIPPNGSPIVLLNDQQTTGGYPVLATVIAADLWKLGQIAPRDKITWELVKLEDAWAIEKLQREELKNLFRSMIHV